MPSTANNQLDQGVITLRGQSPGLAKTSAFTALTEVLLMVLMVCLFIPETVAVFVGPIKLTPAFLVSMLLFPLMLFAVRIKWVWPDIIVVALFFCYFVSTLMSSTVERSIESIGRALLISLVPYFAGRFIVADPGRFKRLLRLLVSLIALMGVFALLESLFRFNIHSSIWPFPYRPHHELRLGLTRAHGWTSHAIMFGLVMATFIPLVAVAYKERIGIVGRVPLIKLFALFLGCFLSLSTGAWGPAALSMMFLAWDYWGPLKHRNRWLLTFVIVVGGYLVLEILSNRPLMRIVMMNFHISSPDAWHYRWRLYERVYEVMPGYWAWGHGLATPDEFVGFERSIDNNFLLLLLTYGKVGLVMWVSVFVSVLLFAGKAVWMSVPTKSVRITRAMCFSLIGMMLTQFSVALFSTPASLYWLMIGMILGMTLVCRAEQRSLVKRRKQAGSQKRTKMSPITTR